MSRNVKINLLNFASTRRTCGKEHFRLIDRGVAELVVHQERHGKLEPGVQEQVKKVRHTQPPERAHILLGQIFHRGKAKQRPNTDVIDRMRQRVDDARGSLLLRQRFLQAEHQKQYVGDGQQHRKHGRREEPQRAGFVREAGKRRPDHGTRYEAERKGNPHQDHRLAAVLLVRHVRYHGHAERNVALADATDEPCYHVCVYVCVVK